ncbi:hypothetical protein AAVH_19874 [Aphelenchoides avenae]|nr:hypothetical protein AAVH_19874 [Aphelenchus avenae]
MERGMDSVHTVTLLYERHGDASTLNLTVNPFGQPRRTGVPTPYSAFIKESYRRDQCIHPSASSATESPVAELFVFENVMSAKKLEVFVWTVEEVENEAQTNLHYAFLLQVAGV